MTFLRNLTVESPSAHVPLAPTVLSGHIETVLCVPSRGGGVCQNLCSEGERCEKSRFKAHVIRKILLKVEYDEVSAIRVGIVVSSHTVHTLFTALHFSDIFNSRSHGTTKEKIYTSYFSKTDGVPR